MRVRNWVGLSLGALLVVVSLACGGVTGECTMGATECDGNTLRACGADGKWYDTPCPDGTTCGEVEGVNTCKPADAPADGGGDAGEGEEGDGGDDGAGGDEGGGGKAKGKGKGKRGR